MQQQSTILVITSTSYHKNADVERPLFNSVIDRFGSDSAHRLGALPDPLVHVRQSHFRLLGQLQGVINLDAEVAYGAFELGVPKQ